jgi:uncharacterized damage-inducible protein DinB
MAPKLKTHHIEIAAGRSRAAMSFLAQLDDQSRRLLVDLRGTTPAELQWQPKRGTNTMGMLLAHLAIVEVYWLQVATGRVSDAGIRKVLGINGDDDGLPLAPAALPPAALHGRTLAFYQKLLAKARACTKRNLRDWTDADLERFVSRTRRTGEVSRQSLRWILYHVLEHEAGHYGQVLLLRHLYRDRRKK